jgi:hypothetical protein
VLVEYESLAAEGRALGGELSFRRLLRGLAGERSVEGAYCYLQPDASPGLLKALGDAGFQVRTITGEQELLLDMAASAMAAAGRSGTVVIAPASAVRRPLQEALQRHEVRVTTAGFEAAQGGEHQVLGRDCIFVP